MAKHDATQWYGPMLKAWPTKLAGPKVTAQQLDTAHKLGARPGKQALANAMYLRPEGATQSQVVAVCGAPQLNKMRGWRDADKVVRQVPMPKSAAGHTVYRIELTAKGAARVKGAADTAPEAAPKAKATPRKRPAKAAKPEAAPVAPQAVTEAAPQA